jgi:hypothetical protein
MVQNQSPEQRARDRIDDQLRASGWVVQSMAALDPSAARGVAVGRALQFAHELARGRDRRCAGSSTKPVTLGAVEPARSTCRQTTGHGS